MQGAEEWCSVGEIRGRDNGTSKRVLDALEVIDLEGRQSEVERELQ